MGKTPPSTSQSKEFLIKALSGAVATRDRVAAGELEVFFLCLISFRTRKRSSEGFPWCGNAVSCRNIFLSRKEEAAAEGIFAQKICLFMGRKSHESLLTSRLTLFLSLCSVFSISMHIESQAYEKVLLIFFFCICRIVGSIGSPAASFSQWLKINEKSITF